MPETEAYGIREDAAKMTSGCLSGVASMLESNADVLAAVRVEDDGSHARQNTTFSVKTKA
jgi:hypothetical protein